MESAEFDTTSAQGILRLGNAFCQAQVLLTAAELDLFTELRDGPLSEVQIRDRLGLDGRGLRDFLALLAVLGLLVFEDGRYRNGEGAQQYLVSDRPGYVGGFLRGAKANLYHPFDGLTETLRTGVPQAASDGFEAMLNDPAELRRYARMMDGVLRPLIPELVKALDWSRHGSVLDVGGCQGGLVGELVKAHPGLTGHVFDLPQMSGPFADYMAEIGAADAVTFHGGDFFADPLPRADVVIFGHVLHNWSAERRARLVRSAFEAVNPGGVLVVYDRMLTEEEGSDNLVASLIMALVTEEGAEYQVSELTALAEDAGFVQVTHRPLGDNETLVVCHRP
jgi:SAM-dependent methyltransferase